MKYWILLLSCWSVAAGADERAAVFGRWASEGSVIEIVESDGRLHARVIALLNPVYREDEAGQVGAVRVDLKNPDAALRAQPIIGIDLLEDYSFEDGKWQGRIYDPESGNTYKSQMSVDGDGNLRMRGYIGVPMLGRTAIFHPISACSGNIPQMLALASLESDCRA
jgi:uncharacterized protein (DUF2147 family)